MVGDPDLSDHRGIWLTNVITTAVLNRSDESPVKMKFMIPWHCVGSGATDVQSTESTIGFKAGAGQRWLMRKAKSNERTVPVTGVHQDGGESALCKRGCDHRDTSS